MTEINRVVISSGHSEFCRGAAGILDEVDEAEASVTIVEENRAGRRDSDQSCATCFLHAVDNDGTSGGTSGTGGLGAGGAATGGTSGSSGETNGGAGGSGNGGNALVRGEPGARVTDSPWWSWSCDSPSSSS